METLQPPPAVAAAAAVEEKRHDAKTSSCGGLALADANPDARPSDATESFGLCQEAAADGCDAYSGESSQEVSSSTDLREGDDLLNRQHQYHHYPHRHQSNLVNLALRHWSFYLGNMLLNYIRKENSGNQTCPSSEAANSSTSDTGGHGATSSQCGTTTVTPTPFCPCCHYHTHVAQQQQHHQQQQQHHQQTNSHSGYPHQNGMANYGYYSYPHGSSYYTAAFPLAAAAADAAVRRGPFAVSGGCEATVSSRKTPIDPTRTTSLFWGEIGRANERVRGGPSHFTTRHTTAGSAFSHSLTVGVASRARSRPIPPSWRHTFVVWPMRLPRLSMQKGKETQVTG